MSYYDVSQPLYSGCPKARFTFVNIVPLLVFLLSDVYHNRKWTGRYLECQQRENIQEGKRFDCSYKSPTVWVL